jgi:hypothetical protein
MKWTFARLVITIDPVLEHRNGSVWACRRNGETANGRMGGSARRRVGPSANATKWHNRTAQGFSRFSPGYDNERECALPARRSSGNVGRRRERAPEQDSERARCVCDNPRFERDVWRGNTRGGQPFRSPLQGESLLGPGPGLKPWAILLCHFVATSRIALSPNRPFAVSQLDPEIFPHEVIKHSGR